MAPYYYQTNYRELRFPCWMVRIAVQFSLQIGKGLLRYDSAVILESMKIGERGQVTIPKEIRDRFGLGTDTEVVFGVVGGSIVLKKAPKKLELRKWKGRCKDSLAELGYSSVDSFMDDLRGR
jgi:AbrB family looped-hinge helix DNA binding protein